jgi:prepilin-type N-terminal cleavage/methylation domain-containing protein
VRKRRVLNACLQCENAAEGESKRSAFTLIELLVAIAVLGLVLVLMAQAVNGVMRSTQAQNQQMDAMASGRRALDVMVLDLGLAVIGENASVLVPTDAGDSLVFAVLANRRHPAEIIDQRFLAVRYAHSDGKLTRFYQSVNFSDPNPLAAASTTNLTTSFEVSGILAMEVRAIDESGTEHGLSPASPAADWATAGDYNGTPVPSGHAALITPVPAFAAELTGPRTKTLEIWVAAVNDQVASLIESGGFTDTISSAFSDASSPSEWRKAIDDDPDIPASIKSGIVILTKTVSLL